MATQTPMMAQWSALKEEAKEAILLFRLGDFYEAFYDDATRVSQALHLTLTARQSIPMCGVPFHTAEVYIDKLLAQGFKVAVAEQTEDPKEAKGLVRREIVRIVTPATVIHSSLLSEKKNNFFASLLFLKGHFGLSLIDLSTGEFCAAALETLEELKAALYRFQPRELLTTKEFQNSAPHLFEELSYGFPFLLNTQEHFIEEKAKEALLFHFDLQNPHDLSIKAHAASMTAAGSLLLYLKEELNLSLTQVISLDPLSFLDTMHLDPATLRHLELFESHSKHTLLHAIDHTVTAMGGRLLASWLKHPLMDPEKIAKRQEMVSFFLQEAPFRERMGEKLKHIKDLERLMAKISSKNGTPREMYALGLSMQELPPIKDLLEGKAPWMAQRCRLDIFDAKELADKILSALSDTPPHKIHEGGIFRQGYDLELDELCRLTEEAGAWMNEYQATLREATGLKTLKVGFTKAFGYYIEISRIQAARVPAHFMRKQTLTNVERFTTEELKEFEHKTLKAEEEKKQREAILFELLREEISLFAKSVYKAAKSIAHLDVLLSFAYIAEEYRFTKPLIDTSNRLEIREGRHPTLEMLLGTSNFIANDTVLDDSLQMMLITGPNMAGKSTYIRQVALIVILAQIGSFVPAQSAHIGVIDKLFSRIGASDDLAKGQSTFMVEMSETATILKHATSRSLVLLDEIGRGTSTYDGIAIAWAVAEYLLTEEKVRAKTLFATHYWELTALEKQFPHAKNFHTAVEEKSSDVTFLRKIIPGGTDKSYGIHVAKLAGLPKKVIHKAEEKLKALEKAGVQHRKIAHEQLLFFLLLFFFHFGFAGDAEYSHKAFERRRIMSEEKMDLLTGSWGGKRAELAEKGVTITSSFVTDIVGNPTGGRARGISYAGSWGLDLLIDFERAVGFKGLSFYGATVWRTGTNLSRNKIGNQFPVQQVYGSQTVKLNTVFLQQTAFEKRLTLRLGRLNGGDTFLQSPYFYDYVNNGFDGNPISVFFSTPFTAYPNAVWGAYLEALPLKKLRIKGGVYQGNQKINQNRFHGINLTFSAPNGVLFASEVGYLNNQEGRGLPGDYKVGFFYITESNPAFLSSKVEKNWVSYLQMDQTLYQRRGTLSAFTTLVWMKKECNLLPFFLSSGLVYEGLFPQRKKDISAVGVCMGSYSSDLRKKQKDAGQRRQHYELIFELNHNFQITPWFLFQPDLQYVVHPSGYNHIENAVVIGFQSQVNF